MTVPDTEGLSEERVDDRNCDDCGGVMSVVWYAPNPLWNRIVGGPDCKFDPGGYLCPSCFDLRADEALGHRLIWRADIPGDLEGLEARVDELSADNERLAARVRESADNWRGNKDRECANLTKLLQGDEPYSDAHGKAIERLSNAYNRLEADVLRAVETASSHPTEEIEGEAKNDG